MFAEMFHISFCQICHCHMEMHIRHFRIGFQHLLIVLQGLVDISFHKQILSGAIQALEVFLLLVFHLVEGSEKAFSRFHSLVFVSVFQVCKGQQGKDADILRE